MKNDSPLAGIEENLADIFGITPIWVEVLLLILSFIIGVAIIIIYTGYSFTIVKICPQNGLKRRMIYFMTDIVFWINTAIVAFIAYYKLNGAAIRPYCFMWILCGMIIAYNIKLKITKKRSKKYTQV